MCLKRAREVENIGVHMKGLSVVVYYDSMKNVSNSSCEVIQGSSMELECGRQLLKLLSREAREDSAACQATPSSKNRLFNCNEATRSLYA